MARALQYYHCALQDANLWTLEPSTPQTIATLIPASLTQFIAALESGDD